MRRAPFPQDCRRWLPRRRPYARRLGEDDPRAARPHIGAALTHYVERLGFEVRHSTEDFAVLARDDAVLHLWAASDGEWRTRTDFSAEPVCSGAEYFLAGTASCRIEVADIDALFAELKRAGVLHGVSDPGVSVTEWGTREFAALDLDGNLLAFFHRVTESR